MSFFTPGEGFHAPGEGPGGGHASITADGNDNIVVASGKKILFQTNTGEKNIATVADEDNGLQFNPNTIIAYPGGTQTLRLEPGLSRMFVKAQTEAGAILQAGGEVINVPSADQSITGAADNILANAAHLKLTSDASYSMTGAIANGTDGQIIKLENVGSFNIVLQDDTSVAGTNLELVGGASQTLTPTDTINFVFSTDSGHWKQDGTRMAY